EPVRLASVRAGRAVDVAFRGRIRARSRAISRTCHCIVAVMQREYTPALRAPVLFIRKFQLEVVEGPERGKRVDSLTDELTIGASRGNDLVLPDESVSRHHCVLRASERGLELRDLGSKNGTFVGACEVVRGFIRSEARLGLGKTVVAVRILNDEVEHPI